MDDEQGRLLVLTFVARYIPHRAHTKIEGNNRLAGG